MLVYILQTFGLFIMDYLRIINYSLLIILGLIIIAKRFKIKAYPFIITAWICPILLGFYMIESYFSNITLNFFFTLIFYIIYMSYTSLPNIIITVLAITLRKKGVKGQISIRAPKSTITFPIERELIFISYATADSEYFQIPRITQILTRYPEIDEILYWESDMHDDIYRYMDTNLKRCKIVLLFCSKNSLYSEAVIMEWSSALKLNKKIIPVFIEPDDIPTLLTTKLGVQFNKSDPYYTIEEIYKMILKKLEIESVREFTKFIIPKWITQKDFEELNIETTEDSSVFDSDIPSNDLGKQIALILQNNNFYVPDLEVLQKQKKPKKIDRSSFGSELKQFMCFAELKDNPDDIALSIKIQKITDSTSKVFITIRGRRNWVLKELLKDIDSKLIEMKNKTELIRNYSGRIISLLEWISDIEKFLRRHLGSNVNYIEEIIDQYKNEQINEEEFVIKGTQLLGKGFITVFIKNIPLILKEKKKILDKKPLDQTPVAF